MDVGSESDRLYREGVAAIRGGDKATARTKLTEAVRLDQTHEQAWLWLSAAVQTNDERITCLQNVLTINPNNDAARRGLEKLGLSTAIDTDLAGHAVEPQVNQPAAVQEAPHRLQHGSSYVAETLEESTRERDERERKERENRDRAEQAASAGREIRPGSVPKSPYGPDEAWRSRLYENSPVPTGAGAQKNLRRAAYIDDEAEYPKRNLLDLIDAWFAAIVFNLDGAYAGEMRVASLGWWLFNVFMVGVLSGLGAILSLLLSLTINHTTIDAYLNEIVAPLVEQGVQIPAFLTGGAFLGTYLAVSIFGTIIGLFFIEIMTHVAAGWLGGKGSFVETLHAMSIAAVAQQIVALLPALVVGFVPGLAGIVGLVMWLYGLALNVTAVSSAHRDFGIGKSLAALFFGWVFLVIFGCCSIFGFGFLAALGTPR